MMAVLKTVKLVQGRVRCSELSRLLWFRPSAPGLHGKFGQRMETLGVNFLSSDKATNVSFLPSLSFLDFLILVVSRYTGLLPQ